ncbi:MAG: tyrosine-protein phosphatase [Bacillus sp. (in: firmicutes)]
MIDLHSHILMGVDDGAKNVMESIEMAKAAEREGIRTIVATPHHMNGRYENKKQDIIHAVAKLNHILQNEKVNLQVMPGQEIRIYGELIEDYKCGEILPINDGRYLFIELPTAHVPLYASQLFYEIQCEGLIPVIVHPERNQVFLQNPGLLFDFVEKGALTQVTAASIIGEFGKKAKKFSLQLIEHNLTHFIASDAHNITTRSFKLKEAYQMIEKKMNADFVSMFRKNASAIIHNQLVYAENPQRIEKKKVFFIF